MSQDKSLRFLVAKITKGGIYWLSSTQTIEPSYTGVAGLLFVSNADISKRVFFPASGYVIGTSLDNGGTDGYYWSSSPHTYYIDNAYYLGFDSRNGYTSSNGIHYHYFGNPVRPVSD